MNSHESERNFDVEVDVDVDDDSPVVLVVFVLCVPGAIELDRSLDDEDGTAVLARVKRLSKPPLVLVDRCCCCGVSFEVTGLELTVKLLFLPDASTLVPESPIVVLFVAVVVGVVGDVAGSCSKFRKIIF